MREILILVGAEAEHKVTIGWSTESCDSDNKLKNLRNEFHFSDVYRRVNYIGSRAK